MDRELRWYDYITINLYIFGISFAAGSITPLLLPYLVALFVPEELKNTYLATIRVVSLAVAMLIQPVAGLLSDRSTHRLGRRRPFIIGSAVVNILFLGLVAASPLFVGSALDETLAPVLSVSVAYVVLMAGLMLLQVSSNTGQAAVQGLIPDLVPVHQRGRASGVKAVMELVPSIPLILVGALVGQGKIWLTTGLIMGVFLVTMLVTVLGVHEEPQEEPPPRAIGGLVLRLVALTAIFVSATRVGVWLVSYSGSVLAGQGAEVMMQVAVVGLAGLLGMAGSIFVGVYLGARVGIGARASEQTSFIWWVVNRLLFLAAVGSIQGFALYYLRDVLLLPDAERWTGVLLAFVAIFLIASALGGGYLSDRLGRRRLVALSAVVAAAGTFLLLLAGDITLVIVAGSIIGLGAGTFMATNWALGTDLVPPEEAGRYLGISNLAGAGAGIVGAGIGGPMADFFNALEPGLGYLVIFGLYGMLFLLSAVALTQVKTPARGMGPA
ncbi:MAG: MFS transporter [Anaerolineae bacterium]|nr:MFS transporter [Anaerolineae bacterium]